MPLRVDRPLIALLALTILGCEPKGPAVPSPTTAPATFDVAPMAVKANPMRPTPLQLAIDRGRKADGELAEELRKLGDYTLVSAEDADAICEALRSIDYARSDKKHLTSDLNALVALFQNVEDAKSAAVKVLRESGTKELIRIVDASFSRSDANHDDLLYVLKILAMYGTREGAERIVAAARLPVKSDGYMWSVILRAIGGDHPQHDFLFAELSDPLPPEFIGLALLDRANQAALEQTLSKHPFDNAAGIKRLQDWLTGDEPDQFSYAVSATVALPFLKHAARKDLFSLAARHPDIDVRIEAAWAQAKLGEQAGIDQLSKLCLDINCSAKAQRYLEELDHEEAIPDEAVEPDFQARARFAEWLAHPNELGRPPDTVEIVDRRELRWPPERKPRLFWLLRYQLRDETGLEADDVNCGLVGSTTFCLFSYELHRRPPEDRYAIHCYWEMEGSDLIEERELENPGEHADFLQQWKGEKLESPVMLTVAEMAPRLAYPQRQVALASAKCQGQEGWVVLDGPRSTWYSQEEMPFETAKSTVLKVHVGRELLGFRYAPDRKKFLANVAPAPTSTQIVEIYEGLLNDAATGDLHRRTKLLTGYASPLNKHFEHYLEAKASLEGKSNSSVLVPAYERLLAASMSGGDDLTAKSVGSTSSPIMKQFDAYVDALVAMGRTHDVRLLIDRFRPLWDHNLGYGKLGAVAYRIGLRADAEVLFVKILDGNKNYCRSEAMDSLAELWHGNGNDEKAKSLLIDCMKKLVMETSKHASDRKMFEEAFQSRRSTFLRLFPTLGEAELARRGIPNSTRP